ncbi:DUF5685 family protein [Lachnospiraceae bacterium 48-21]
MFGYIAINKAEMKFKDYEMYHSYYCGLCKCLKERYGIRGQVTLSFDMTFLIVLLTGLYEPLEEKEVVNCIAHPLEKHIARTNEFTEYAAAVNLILSYYKCKDDWEDDHKRKSYIAAKLLTPKMKDICRQYPSKVAAISSNLRRLSVLERENEQNIDLVAGLFGNIMAELFAYRKDEWEASLRKIGFFLGKFIYLMDAYTDVAEDIRTHNYNPFKDAYQNDSQFSENCRKVMTLMMAECSREFEKLPILLHTDILRNILYSGVWQRYTDNTNSDSGEEK